MVQELDTKGLSCPLPIVKLAKKMKELQPGEEMVLVSDDPGSKDDVPAWCNRTGNEFVELNNGGDVFTFRLRKKGA